jgi:hypothetical protein
MVQDVMVVELSGALFCRGERGSGEPPGNSRVVGDDEGRGPKLALHLFQEVQDPTLDRGIEPGRGFVGDEHLGTGGEGHGDHDALAHPSRKVVRIISEPLRGRVEVRAGKPRFGFLSLKGPMLFLAHALAL